MSKKALKIWNYINLGVLIFYGYQLLTVEEISFTHKATAAVLFLSITLHLWLKYQYFGGDRE